MKPPGFLQKADRVLYAIEYWIVVVSMATMIATVFFDVLDRRLQARESKLVNLLAAVLGPVGGRAADGSGPAPWIAGFLAPLITIALLFGLAWFAVVTLRGR